MCVAAAGGPVGGERLATLGGSLPRLGEGACARGAARGGRLAVVAVPSPRHAAPTPLPWCIAVSGEGGPAAALRTGGPIAPSRSQCLQWAVVRSGPAAAAGAPGYEWSGAGLEPASGDSWEEAGFLRAGDGVQTARSPSGGGKLTSLGARRRGSPGVK